MPAGNATVILVIDDLGIVKRTTRNMIEMDIPLTLAFLPYASDISRQVNDAYNNSHDVLVHIPMEPKGKADPGPHALLSSTEPRVQMDSINYNLSQFENYIGINNNKNLYYIMGQLDELARTAMTNGNALGIGHPYPETVAALNTWVPTLEDKGLTFVPMSQTFHTKGMVKIKDHFYLSAVEVIEGTETYAKTDAIDDFSITRPVGKGRGWLFKFSLTAKLVSKLELTEGDAYHPGSLELVDLSIKKTAVRHQVPITTYLPSGVVLSHNPFWTKVYENKMRFYFMPEKNGYADLHIHEVVLQEHM